MSFRTFLTGLFAGIVGIAQLHGQSINLFGTPSSRSEIYNYTIPEHVDIYDEFFDFSTAPDDVPSDSLRIFPLSVDSLLNTMYVPTTPMPRYYFRPVVFDSYQLLDSLRLNSGADFMSLNDPTYGWLATDAYHANLMRHAKQAFIINSPGMVRYNEADLPEPPRKFEAKVDPSTAKIVIAEVVPTVAPKKEMSAQFERRHWLQTFNASLHFSQAYVSPNWYQGGNSNLNILTNLFYNLKLNPAFHKQTLFEMTLQYKLGLNDAPDDSIRNYSISDDLFQFNMLAGYKASKHWYYSTNVMFKTQLMQNYKSNTRDLKGAFLSPGELNVGVGMTYNFANPKKTFTIDASISPFSWNMKTCINHRMNETAYGIKEGRRSVSEFGSNAEGNLYWAMCDNINIRSRLFVFTDYTYAYGNWENTISFAINRFLTTQIYVNMRYDTSTSGSEDSGWHKLQLKEILSFGFSYKFANI
ncbi:MAG: DUF3078 domain-containing protein [Staphylococcus sp.]|nr:DUF3078 domain-containing protein [Staphylococcus sp.]